jgi:hypothetical protein
MVGSQGQMPAMLLDAARHEDRRAALEGGGCVGLGHIRQ